MSKKASASSQTIGEVKLSFVLTAKPVSADLVEAEENRAGGRRGAGSAGARRTKASRLCRGKGTVSSLTGNFCWLDAKAGMTLPNIRHIHVCDPDTSTPALAAACEPQPAPKPGDPRRWEAGGDGEVKCG